MNKRLSNSQGFTLVELLVALTIFAVGLLSIASMMVTSMRANTSSTLRTEAVALGQSRMESLLARATDDPLFSGAETTSVETVNLPGGGIYTVTSKVSPASPIADLATLTIQIRNAAGNKLLSSFEAYKRTK